MSSPAINHSAAAGDHSPAALASGTLVVAIDPGSAKCGIAVVSRDLAVHHRAVEPTMDLIEAAALLVQKFSPDAVIIGDGTGSQPLARALQQRLAGLPLVVVDESYSSEEARARFVAENRAPLLQRLLPRSLRSPWRPYDDYVAVVIAERYWAQQRVKRA